ncbi:hypothetical protein ISCGN_008070 [Ixodes scapularis]
MSNLAIQPTEGHFGSLVYWPEPPPNLQDSCGGSEEHVVLNTIKPPRLSQPHGQHPLPRHFLQLVEVSWRTPNLQATVLAMLRRPRRPALYISSHHHHHYRRGTAGLPGTGCRLSAVPRLS